MKIPVTIKKFDNQARSYKLYRVIQVTEENLLSTLRAFGNGQYQSVKEFYAFTFVYKGTEATIYHLSPWIFDQAATLTQ